VNNVILLFVRFGHILVFLALEVLCIVLVVNYNEPQKEIWLNSVNIFSGSTASVFDSWTDYLNLKDEAEKLAAENARLRSQLLNPAISSTPLNPDSLDVSSQQFTYIPAKIFSKTINQPDNYFFINKGENQGITQGMGVTSSNGIVGIVAQTSADNAKVITILHRQSNISAANTKNGAFGTLKWRDFTDYKHVQLEAYPRHEDLEQGDTIVTSGYSAHFPEGIMIGLVDTLTLSKSDYFYNAKIELSNNLSTLRYVYVIQNLQQDQQREIINGNQPDR